MTGSPKHGWAVWGAMAFLFLAGVTTAYWAEARGNPLLTTAGADQTVTRDVAGRQHGREGSPLRHREHARSSRPSTTDASCGAINGWHDSFTPIGGLVPLANIQLSEVVFGGVGAGLYGMLVYIILSVFIAGLMVGRTPEYLGQEDPGLRRADGDAQRPHLPAVDSRVHGDLVGVAELRDGEHPQSGTARPVRDPLRLLVGRRPTTGRRSAA